MYQVGSLSRPATVSSQAVPAGGQSGGFTTIYPVTESMELGDGESSAESKLFLTYLEVFMILS